MWPSNDPLTLGDAHRMTGENADSVPLPVANCVLCRWPMDGTVNILEVYVGAFAVYRACADECPPAGVDRRRYLDERYAEARRVEREIRKARRSLADPEYLMNLERRLSVLLGRDAPRRVVVHPRLAAGLSAAEIVKGVREQPR
jgi:hypothetical protein